MSIFGKFSLAVGLALIVALATATFFTLQSQNKALTREAVLRGDSIGVNLAAASTDALISGDPYVLIPLAFSATQDHQDVEYAAIVDRNGIVRSHGEQSMLNQVFERPQGEELEGFPHSVVDAGEFWNIEVPIVPKGTKVVLGHVHLGMSKKNIENTVRAQIWRVLAVSATVLVLAVLVVFIIVRVLVQPIQKLSAAAQKVGEGKLDIQVEVPSKDELGSLVGHFNSMVANLERAERVKLEQQRMASELNVANRIQAGLLPDTPPERKDVDVAFACVPAKELGGDFFDWFELDQGKRIGFVIADVSGKGVGAALHMTNLRNMVRFVVGGKSVQPMEVLKQVNTLAWPDLKGESFVTMIYMVYDPAKGAFQIACAGHDPAVKIKNEGETEDFGGKGMPIGIAEAEDFDPILKETSGTLKKGESLALYTDGITEAMDGQRNQFGEEKMKKALAKSASSAAAIIENLLESVRKHAAGVEQSDDITTMVIRRV